LILLQIYKTPFPDKTAHSQILFQTGTKMLLLSHILNTAIRQIKKVLSEADKKPAWFSKKIFIARQ
jgi:hypothetical protein